MAGRKRSSDGTNKSAFIRSILEENADASAKEVKAAWEKSGHKEELNMTLYYQIRKELGLAKMRGGKRVTRKATRKMTSRVEGPASSSSVNGIEMDYLAFEKQLDMLVTKADSLGDHRLADDLRVARRRVSNKLV